MTTANDRQVLTSILNPNLPLGEGLYDPEEEGLVENDPLQALPPQLKELEKQAMLAAEKGDTDTSIQLFGQIISASPNSASTYNNRAQALRLAGRPEEAKADLEKALNLSGGIGKVAANSLCQRGVLNRKDGHDDAALDDFKAAADLGSGFARSMLVELNPYAAMCNAMLRNVFTAMADGNPNPDERTTNVKYSG